MLAVFSLAATQMKMTPAESISAATINAAYSLGRGAKLGSLENNKSADFVIHDCDDYRELSYFFWCGARVAGLRWWSASF
jgi:imidazolonepropionase